MLHSPPLSRHGEGEGHHQPIPPSPAPAFAGITEGIRACWGQGQAACFFPLRSSSCLHAPEALQGRWAPPTPSPHLHSTSFSLSINSAAFFPFAPLPDTHTASAPGTIFLSTGQSDKLKIFLPRRTQAYHLICLLFRKNNLFRLAEGFYLTYVKKKCLFFSSTFFFFYFWKEVFQIKNVTAKWETKIVHLLQIISPFFLPQNRAWRTKSVNSPQTVLSKTKQRSHWHSSSFLLPFSLFSLQFFPYVSVPITTLCCLAELS